MWLWTLHAMFSTACDVEHCTRLWTLHLRLVVSWLWTLHVILNTALWLWTLHLQLKLSCPCTHQALCAMTSSVCQNCTCTHIIVRAPWLSYISRAPCYRCCTSPVPYVYIVLYMYGTFRTHTYSWPALNFDPPGNGRPKRVCFAHSCFISHASH